MNEEENNEQEEVQDSKIKQAASKAGKQIVDEAKRQISNKMKEVATKIWAKAVAFIIAHLPAILIVLAIIAGCILLCSLFDDFLDGEVTETIDEVTYQSINEYCTIDESGVHFNKEKFITTLSDKLKEENGINLNDLGLGEIIEDANGNEYLNPDSKAAKYLYKYMGASLSSELPYIEGSDEETKGTIKIKRKQNTEAIELTYIGYQKLQDMINSDDRSVKEQSLRYFSLDPSWNLCVTKWKKTSENGQEKSYEIYEVKIPYRRMVSQYTVPFLFLIDLQLISLNANYVDAVADLVKDQSFIDFTIFDSVTTDETTYTYKATRHTRKKHEETTGNTITTSYTETTEEEGPDVTVTKVEIDSIKASVTKAKTWIIDQTITYNLQENKEYQYGEKPGKVEKTSESKPSGEGTWRDPIEKTWYEEIIKHEWVKGATETKFMPSEFLGLWSNKTGKYVKGALYIPTTEVSRRKASRI